MSDLLETLLSNETLRERVIGTLALVLALLALRTAGLRALRTLHWRSESMRMLWHLRIRHVAIAILLIGLAIIWAPQLRSLALSAVAVAAAIVLAVRELLLCFSGSFLRAATEAFAVGDRVMIGDVRGDVISYGLLGTTLLELGPGHQRTGRTVMIPNSQLLTAKVVNETATHDYVLHVITIPLAEEADWRDAEKRLLDIASEVCSSYTSEAREQMHKISEKYGLPLLPVEPRVLLQLDQPGKVLLNLRIPVPARECGPVEQAILRRYLR